MDAYEAISKRITTLDFEDKDINRLRKISHVILISMKSITYKKFVEFEEEAFSDGALTRKYKEIIGVATSVVKKL